VSPTCVGGKEGGRRHRKSTAQNVGHSPRKREEEEAEEEEEEKEEEEKEKEEEEIK
jgi:hypothetical protein